MPKKISLWEKVKNIGMAGLLIPPLILGGCVGDIKVLGTEWVGDETIKREGEIKREKSGEENHYYVKASQNKEEKDKIQINIGKQTDDIYEVRQEVNYFKKQREYMIYTREERTDSLTSTAIVLGITSLALLIAGSQTDEDTGERNTSAQNAGLIGLTLCIPAGIMGTRKKYKNETGNTRLIPLYSEDEYLKREIQKGLRQSPGKFIPVGITEREFSFQGNSKILRTNPNGRTTAKLEETVLEWGFTKENLEKEIKNSALVQEQVQKKYQDEFAELLTKYSSQSKRNITLSTRERSNSFSKVHNSSIKIDLTGYSINKNSVERALKDFVNEYITSELEEKTILIRDKVSHARINHAMIEMQISGTPKKEDLARPYFKGELKNESLKYIKKYLGSEGEREIFYTDSLGKLKTAVYTGTQVEMEVTHPDYHFLKTSSKFDTPTQILDMNDKGEKIRQKEVEE